MNNQDKPKKRFKLFDTQREGPGVEKGEDTTPTLGYFFKLLGRKFWKLVSINLIMLPQILLLVACVFVYTTGPTTPTVMYPAYSALLGAQTAAPTSVGATLLNAASGFNDIPTFDTHVYWVIGVLALIHVLTYGWQKVGSTYIMRNLVRGDGVFILSDFFYAIKKNFRQGFLLGLLDCGVIGLLVADFFIMLGQPASLLTGFISAANVAILILYLFMRFYMYLMLVTFNIKISKILKNALIFTVLGIKRNLMAVLGIAAVLALMLSLIIVSGSFAAAVLPAAIIIPALILLSLISFMYTYAAWPVVEKYMIGPRPDGE